MKKSQTEIKRIISENEQLSSAMQELAIQAQVGDRFVHEGAGDQKLLGQTGDQKGLPQTEGGVLGGQGQKIGDRQPVQETCPHS